MIIIHDFAGEPATTAKGRHGIHKSTGVEIMHSDGEKNYMISPITKRGVLVSCWIEIPRIEFWALVADLEARGQRPAQEKQP